MSELVSVVVCAYNNWPDLELAIQSALCQSHPPVEVIVVDNSSTDATAVEVPARFGTRVRYIRQPNTGDGGAYNAGLAAARGAFLQFLDGDDVLAPNKIEKQLGVFRSDPDADIVFGDVRHFQSLPGEAHWTDIERNDEDVGVEPFLQSEGDCVGSALGVLFRRRAFDCVGKWDETLYRCDADYFLRAAVAGCRFRYSPGGPMSFKRVRPGQMGLDTTAMLEGSEALWVKALGYFTEPAHLERIRFNLARARFLRALRGDRIRRRRAIALCSEARRTSPAAVPVSAYAAGIALIQLPGRRYLATSPRLRTLRRMMTRLLGYRPG
jgi:glycosyltransferase involved in cell wall biosynthesis